MAGKIYDDRRLLILSSTEDETPLASKTLGETRRSRHYSQGSVLGPLKVKTRNSLVYARSSRNAAVVAFDRHSSNESFRTNKLIERLLPPIAFNRFVRRRIGFATRRTCLDVFEFRIEFDFFSQLDTPDCLFRMFELIRSVVSTLLMFNRW